MSKKLMEKKAMVDCLQIVFADIKWSYENAIVTRDEAVESGYDEETTAYRKALVESYEKVIKTLEGLL